MRRLSRQMARRMLCRLKMIKVESPQRNLKNNDFTFELYFWKSPRFI